MNDWNRVQELFHAALAVEDEARAELLDERCAGDDDLRAEVLSLLAEAPEMLPSDEGRAGLAGTSSGLDAVVGSRLGNYAVLREIGRGAMGVVYEAEQERLSRSVALKMVHPADELGVRIGAEAYARAVDRFVDEAETLGRLDHPGIVPIHEMGSAEDGRQWFTMRLVSGQDLTEIMDAHARSDPTWTLSRVVTVLIRVCDTMTFAHERGVIHRDLKPSHVMVGQFGEVYIVDWGLARVVGRSDSKDIRLQDEPSEGDDELRTIDGDVVGTPAYMAPEQARGQLDRMGPAADTYALGAMIYHLLAGHPPHVAPGERTGVHEVLRRVKQGPPLTLDAACPPELVAICDRAMAREPVDRFPSMRAVSDDLQAFLEDRVVQAYQTGAWAQLRTWRRRNRAFASSLAIAIFLLVAGSLAAATLVSNANLELQKSNSDLVDAQKVAVENQLLAEQERHRAETEATLARERANELQVLFDFERVGRLWAGREDALDSIPGIEAWIAEAELLAEFEDKYASRLAELRALGTFSPDGGWRFEDLDQVLFQEKLAGLLDQIRSIGGSMGLSVMRLNLRFSRDRASDEIGDDTLLERFANEELGHSFDVLEGGAFSQLFDRVHAEEVVDGKELLADPLAALAHGRTFLFPAGSYDLRPVVRSWRMLEVFPEDLTLAGAGRDRTHLVFGDLGTRGPIRRLGFKDATIDTANAYLTDARRDDPLLISMERVRVIGFDMGAGGSSAFNAKTLMLKAVESIFEGGYGRSPEFGQLFDVRSAALMGDFDHCTFRLIKTSFGSLRDGAALTFRSCAFEDLLDRRSGDLAELTRSWDDSSLHFEDCTFDAFYAGSRPYTSGEDYEAWKQANEPPQKEIGQLFPSAVLIHR